MGPEGMFMSSLTLLCLHGGNFTACEAGNSVVYGHSAASKLIILSRPWKSRDHCTEIPVCLCTELGQVQQSFLAPFYHLITSTHKLTPHQTRWCKPS